MQGRHSALKSHANMLLSLYFGSPLADAMSPLLLITLKGKPVPDVATPLLHCCTHLPPGDQAGGHCNEAWPLPCYQNFLTACFAVLCSLWGSTLKGISNHF